MSRRGKTYRRIALALIREGHDLRRNGRDLRDIEEIGGRISDEGRLRELAGMLVVDVGSCMLLDADHRSTMGKIRRLGRRIRDAVARGRGPKPGSSGPR